MLPAGLRRKNPGNLRSVGSAGAWWQGQIDEENGFCVFDTYVNGIRALAKNLVSYYVKRLPNRIDTVREAISRWAPSSENNTSAYVAYVANRLEVSPDDFLDFKDRDTLFWLVTAIGEQENGHDAFTAEVTDADIEAGVEAALA